MSFQAYLDNIHAKTGKSPDDFKKLADKKERRLRYPGILIYDSTGFIRANVFLISSGPALSMPSLKP